MLALTVVGSLLYACSEGAAPSTSSTPTSNTTTATTLTTTSTTSTTAPPEARVENLGLAAVWIQQLEDGVAFGVSEGAQGSDLNDDGDTEDVLVHVVVDDRVVNTGL